MKQSKIKGRILATIQFVLLFFIIVSAFLEKNYYNHGYSEIINLMSILLIFIGLVAVILTLIEFKQYMTPNPVPLENAHLRTGGIYSIVRHPMYLSVILMIIGGTLYMKAYHTLFLDMAAIIFLIFKIGFEEKMLVERYPEYKIYRSATKKLIPFIY
jgi:protein-S-isoprenylcysteine O-methyltransferase Ste14